MPCICVEVAVGAAVGAERDVEIKRVIECHVSRIKLMLRRGKPIISAIGPSMRIHMAVWRPNWSARKPMRKGKNFASGAVTEPIAMMLAL